MKIIMLITDSVSYKNYLELYTFFQNNKISVDFSYHFLDANLNNTFLSHPSNNQIYLRWIVSSLSKYIEDKEYGFILQKLVGCNIFFKMMSNMLNNKNIEENLDKEMFGNVLWNIDSKNKHWCDIKDIVQSIPKADLYLISIRDNATRYIQFFLMLSLYKQHNSTVLLGGGGLDKNNCLENLINAFSKEYCDNKIYYSTGDLVSTVTDFINNGVYTNRYTKNICVPDYTHTTKTEMNSVMKNEVFINLTTGCKHNCDYCVGSNCSIYRNKVDLDLVKKNILFLQQNYSNAELTFFDNALDEAQQFEELLIFLNDYKIQNNLKIFTNIYNIDKYIDYFKNLNIHLCIAADLFCTPNTCRDFNIESRFSKNLLTLQKYKIPISMDHVSHIPFYENDYLNQDKIINLYNFCLEHNINILHDEFDLRLGSNMFNEPSKFGIEYSFYKNPYKELIKVEKQITSIPEVFYKDYNRYDRLLDIYNFLKNFKHLYVKALNEYSRFKPMLYVPLLGRMSYMCYIDMSLLVSQDTEFNSILTQYMTLLSLNKKGFFTI